MQTFCVWADVGLKSWPDQHCGHPGPRRLWCWSWTYSQYGSLAECGKRLLPVLWEQGKLWFFFDHFDLSWIMANIRSGSSWYLYYKHVFICGFLEPVFALEFLIRGWRLPSTRGCSCLGNPAKSTFSTFHHHCACYSHKPKVLTADFFPPKKLKTFAAWWIRALSNSSWNPSESNLEWTWTKDRRRQLKLSRNPLWWAFKAKASIGRGQI